MTTTSRHHHQTPPIDPKVAQLAALFPATSNDIIEAVLAAVGGSLEQATETLLSMNDPSFAEPQQVRPFFWCAAGVADLTCASLNSTATPSLRAIWRHKTTTNGVSATPPHPPAIYPTALTFHVGVEHLLWDLLVERDTSNRVRAKHQGRKMS